MSDVIAAAPALFTLHVQSETLVDTLKLLNYDHKFLPKYKLRPLSRLYFADAGATAEQLHYFASLVSWLLSLAGHVFSAPELFDDPNEITSNVMHELRQRGVPTDFPPSKIRQGHGEEVVQILNTLAQNALKATRWKFQLPVHKPASAAADADADNAADADADADADDTTGAGAGANGDIDDEVAEDDGDDDLFAGADAMRALASSPMPPKNAGILESEFNAAEWRMEVERVLPILKVQVRTDHKDWRVHCEQMTQHLKDIEGNMTDTHKSLEKLHGDIGKTLEKIGSREKYLNKQLEHLVQEYRQQQDTLAGSAERYKQASVSVTELSRQLARASDELDTVKAQMDERGTSMTDAGPLVKIKQAHTRIKGDIQDMELRIGVVQHTLLNAKLRSKTFLVHDMNAGRAPGLAY